MRSIRAFFLRLFGFAARRGWERDMADEFESNLQMHIDDNVRAGMDRDEARRAAILRFGAPSQSSESYRDRRSLPFLDTVVQDLRYAARALRKNSGFAVVAVLTLGLGIGANTAMFSVVEAVLLRPMPYPQPDRLIEIAEVNPLKGWTHTVASPANYADWRKMNTVFTDIAAAMGMQQTGGIDFNLSLTGYGEPQMLKAIGCTGNLFDVLDVKPLLGRTFTFDETFVGHRVAMLSYGLWQSAFNRDPAIVGKKIELNGIGYSVIGVMGPDFFFPDRQVQIYVPFGITPDVFAKMRRAHWMSVIARLRPGITLGQARAQMATIAHRLEQAYPDTNTQMGVRLDEFHETLTWKSRTALLMLFGAVALLFLIVCSNVANLQLGRAASRTREIGIRQALGAGRGRLIRQLLTESALLSLLGGVAGIVLAVAARRAILHFAPSAIPSFAELRIDGWVALFSVAVTFGAPLLFGIVPALTASRPERLRDRSETGTPGGEWTRTALVTAEVALSVVLVAGAGLFIRSLIALDHVDPGFNPEHAIGFRVGFPQARYPSDASRAHAVREIERRLRAYPQVRAVGVAMVLPLGGASWTGDATPEGRSGDDYERELRHNMVTPGYFTAAGIRLSHGRLFDDLDAQREPDAIVVNESLERHYFRGQNAVGKTLKFGRPSDPDKDSWVRIIGVIEDEKQDGMDAPVKPEAFSILTDKDSFTPVSFALRGSDDGAMMAAATREIHQLDKDLVVSNIAPLAAAVHAATGDQRFRTSLISIFAGIALLLAALGVYGVLAYSVTRRSRELGIRMALGAPRSRMFGMVVRDGMLPVAAGLVLGVAGAWIGSGLVRSLLFGVAPNDVPTLGATIGVLTATALCACMVPAARAIGVDPLVSLREQ